MNPNRFYRIARELANLEFALDNTKVNVHISIITWGKSYSIGINNEKSHPDIYYNYAPFKTMLHSEKAAHIKCKFISDKPKTLINFRFSRSKNIPLMSRPCSDCLEWCAKEFEHIYYSDFDGQLVKLY
jgi:hypothetical protein